MTVLKRACARALFWTSDIVTARSTCGKICTIIFEKHCNMTSLHATRCKIYSVIPTDVNIQLSDFQANFRKRRFPSTSGCSKPQNLHLIRSNSIQWQRKHNYVSSCGSPGAKVTWPTDGVSKLAASMRRFSWPREWKRENQVMVEWLCIFCNDVNLSRSSVNCNIYEGPWVGWGWLRGVRGGRLNWRSTTGRGVTCHF